MSIRPEEFAEMLADEMPMLERAVHAIEHVAYDDTTDDIDDALHDLQSGLQKLREAIRRRGQKDEG